MKKKITIKRWITRYFIIVLLVSMILAAGIDLRETYESKISESKAEAIMCAENVVSLLNTECSLEDIQNYPNDEIFIEAREVLHEQCKSSQMDYVYVYTIDSSDESRYYYVCAGLTDKENDIALSDFSKKTRPIVELLQGEKTILEGEKGLVKDSRKNKYGDDIVWLYPYYDTDSNLRAIVGMDYNNDRLIRDVSSHFLKDIIPFVILLIISMLFLLYLIQRRIVKPVKTISDSMNHFAKDSGTKPKPLNITQTDEIGEIASSYEKMTEDISLYINNIEELTKERLENEVQLKIARNIQYGLVPEKMNISGEGFSISAMTSPAKAVGGDFYDAFVRDDGKVCVFMGDVSGKGITAALCMAMVKTAIRENLSAGLSPAEALNRVNEELYRQNTEGMFVTAFAAVLETATGNMVYANAGHTYSVYLKTEPELIIPDSGIALGLFDDEELFDVNMNLSKGQGILLYTDGVTEAISRDNQLFGTDRLLDALRHVPKGTNDSSDYIMTLSNEVKEFSEGCDPFDDMAILALLRLN